jgi:outer membrane protein insertion porin family
MSIGKVNIILLLGLVLSSCSNTRKLPEGSTLYVGSRVSIEDNEASRRERKVLREDLAKATRPKPNTTLLGIRLKLTIYNFFGGDSVKGFRKKIRDKYGEPPVLTSQFDLDKNKQTLTNILENRGFFYPTVHGELKTRRKKTRAIFDVYTGPQYKIHDITFPQDTDRLSRDILDQSDRTLLKIDAPYNLDLMKGERDRIDKNLKEIGYYYFTPDYLIMQIDSNVGGHKVDVYIKPKNDMPPEARDVYTINDVYLYTNYRLNKGRRKVDSTDKKNDTTFYERYYIIGDPHKYKPFIFTQAMQFSPGDLYNRTDQNTALNRLVNMGTFKFVKNEFVPISNWQLNTFYYLTPYPKKSLQLEVGGVSKSDSRTGSQISLSWRNRNTFRAAELLSIKITAGAETQYSGAVNRPPTTEYGFEPSITFPRFFVPFWKPNSSSLFVPHTTIKLNYNMLQRSNLYNLESFKAGYGFVWKEDVRTEHQLYPINITYVRTDTLNKDTTFYINYNNLVFNGLIFGPTYEFTYNSRGNGAPRIDDYYFDGLIDMSGNLFGLAQGTSLSEGPKTIYGNFYAQYVKLMADFRYYHNYNADPNSIWANRIIIGVGIPYGNSYQLPNIKQFFSGGNSSLRGFRSRLVGPGSFNEKYLYNTQKIIETSGDIRLELNSELRGKLYSFINGAVFIDAGNVWLYRPNPKFPGGEFTGKFLSQLAVDAGVGLRLDFKILVLRLDAGVPLRKPWLVGTQAWQSNTFDFRGDDLIFNIAIGYPF